MATQEKRNQENKIRADIEKMDKPLDIKTIKGRLRIQGELFKPKVAPPTPKEIVDMTPQEMLGTLLNSKSRHLGKSPKTRASSLVIQRQCLHIKKSESCTNT